MMHSRKNVRPGSHGNTHRSLQSQSSNQAGIELNSGRPSSTVIGGTSGRKRTSSFIRRDDRNKGEDTKQREISKSLATEAILFANKLKRKEDGEKDESSKKIGTEVSSTQKLSGNAVSSTNLGLPRAEHESDDGDDGDEFTDDIESKPSCALPSVDDNMLQEAKLNYRSKRNSCKFSDGSSVMSTCRLDSFRRMDDGSILRGSPANSTTTPIIRRGHAKRRQSDFGTLRRISDRGEPYQKIGSPHGTNLSQSDLQVEWMKQLSPTNAHPSSSSSARVYAPQSHYNSDLCPPSSRLAPQSQYDSDICPPSSRLAPQSQYDSEFCPPSSRAPLSHRSKSVDEEIQKEPSCDSGSHFRAVTAALLGTIHCPHTGGCHNHDTQQSFTPSCRTPLLSGRRNVHEPHQMSASNIQTPHLSNIQTPHLTGRSQTHETQSISSHTTKTTRSRRVVRRSRVGSTGPSEKSGRSRSSRSQAMNSGHEEISSRSGGHTRVSIESQEDSTDKKYNGMDQSKEVPIADPNYLPSSRIGLEQSRSQSSIKHNYQSEDRELQETGDHYSSLKENELLGKDLDDDKFNDPSQVLSGFHDNQTHRKQSQDGTISDGESSVVSGFRDHQSHRKQSQDGTMSDEESSVVSGFRDHQSSRKQSQNGAVSDGESSVVSGFRDHQSRRKQSQDGAVSDGESSVVSGFRNHRLNCNARFDSDRVLHEDDQRSRSVSSEKSLLSARQPSHIATVNGQHRMETVDENERSERSFLSENSVFSDRQTSHARDGSVTTENSEFSAYQPSHILLEHVQDPNYEKGHRSRQTYYHHDDRLLRSRSLSDDSDHHSDALSPSHKSRNQSAQKGTGTDDVLSPSNWSHHPSMRSSPREKAGGHGINRKSAKHHQNRNHRFAHNRKDSRRSQDSVSSASKTLSRDASASMELSSDLASDDQRAIEKIRSHSSGSRSRKERSRSEHCIREADALHRSRKHEVPSKHSSRSTSPGAPKFRDYHGRTLSQPAEVRFNRDEKIRNDDHSTIDERRPSSRRNASRSRGRVLSQPSRCMQENEDTVPDKENQRSNNLNNRTRMYDHDDSENAQSDLSEYNTMKIDEKYCLDMEDWSVPVSPTSIISLQGVHCASPPDSPRNVESVSKEMGNKIENEGILKKENERLSEDIEMEKISEHNENEKISESDIQMNSKPLARNTKRRASMTEKIAATVKEKGLEAAKVTRKSLTNGFKVMKKQLSFIGAASKKKTNNFHNTNMNNNMNSMEAKPFPPHEYAVAQINNNNQYTDKISKLQDTVNTLQSQLHDEKQANKEATIEELHDYIKELHVELNFRDEELEAKISDVDYWKQESDWSKTLVDRVNREKHEQIQQIKIEHFKSKQASDEVVQHLKTELEKNNKFAPTRSFGTQSDMTTSMLDHSEGIQRAQIVDVERLRIENVTLTNQNKVLLEQRKEKDALEQKVFDLQEDLKELKTLRRVENARVRREMKMKSEIQNLKDKLLDSEKEVRLKNDQFNKLSEQFEALKSAPQLVSSPNRTTHVQMDNVMLSSIPESDTIKQSSREKGEKIKEVSEEGEESFEVRALSRGPVVRSPKNRSMKENLSKLMGSYIENKEEDTVIPTGSVPAALPKKPTSLSSSRKGSPKKSNSPKRSSRNSMTQPDSNRPSPKNKTLLPEKLLSPPATNTDVKATVSSRSSSSAATHSDESSVPTARGSTSGNRSSPNSSQPPSVGGGKRSRVIKKGTVSSQSHTREGGSSEASIIPGQMETGKGASTLSVGVQDSESSTTSVPSDRCDQIEKLLVAASAAIVASQHDECASPCRSRSDSLTRSAQPQKNNELSIDTTAPQQEDCASLTQSESNTFNRKTELHNDIDHPSLSSTVSPHGSNQLLEKTEMCLPQNEFPLEESIPIDDASTAVPFDEEKILPCFSDDTPVHTDGKSSILSQLLENTPKLYCSDNLVDGILHSNPDDDCVQQSNNEHVRDCSPKIIFDKNQNDVPVAEKIITSSLDSNPITDALTQSQSEGQESVSTPITTPLEKGAEVGEVRSMSKHGSDSLEEKERGVRNPLLRSCDNDNRDDSPSVSVSAQKDSTTVVTDSQIVGEILPPVLSIPEHSVLIDLDTDVSALLLNSEEKGIRDIPLTVTSIPRHDSLIDLDTEMVTPCVSSCNSALQEIIPVVSSVESAPDVPTSVSVLQEHGPHNKGDSDVNTPIVATPEKEIENNDIPSSIPAQGCLKDCDVSVPREDDIPAAEDKIPKANSVPVSSRSGAYAGQSIICGNVLMQSRKSNEPSSAPSTHRSSTNTFSNFLSGARARLRPVRSNSDEFGSKSGKTDGPIEDVRRHSVPTASTLMSEDTEQSPSSMSTKEFVHEEKCNNTPRALDRTTDCPSTKNYIRKSFAKKDQIAKNTFPPLDSTTVTATSQKFVISEEGTETLEPAKKVVIPPKFLNKQPSSSRENSITSPEGPEERTASKDTCPETLDTMSKCSMSKESTSSTHGPEERTASKDTCPETLDTMSKCSMSQESTSSTHGPEERTASKDTCPETEYRERMASSENSHGNEMRTDVQDSGSRSENLSCELAVDVSVSQEDRKQEEKEIVLGTKMNEQIIDSKKCEAPIQDKDTKDPSNSTSVSVSSFEDEDSFDLKEFDTDLNDPEISELILKQARRRAREGDALIEDEEEECSIVSSTNSCRFSLEEIMDNLIVDGLSDTMPTRAAMKELEVKWRQQAYQTGMEIEEYMKKQMSQNQEVGLEEYFRKQVAKKQQELPVNNQ